jgi:DNA modification methylase
LAAKNTGRRAYGFELVKEYVDAFYEKILPCAMEDMFTAMARQEKAKQLELTKLLYRKEA